MQSCHIKTNIIRSHKLMYGRQRRFIDTKHKYVRKPNFSNPYTIRFHARLAFYCLEKRIKYFVLSFMLPDIISGYYIFNIHIYIYIISWNLTFYANLLSVCVSYIGTNISHAVSFIIIMRNVYMRNVYTLKVLYFACGYFVVINWFY